MAINCFVNNGYPTLQKELDDRVAAGENEYVVARELVLREQKGIQLTMNEAKTSLKLPPSEMQEKDISEKINQINEEYDAKINKTITESAQTAPINTGKVVEDLAQQDIFDDISKAEQSKKSQKAKAEAAGAAANSYGEQGQKALIIHRNFDSIVSQLQKSNKLKVKC